MACDGINFAVPLVSVIVPAYNSMPYLPACVDSILGQSYANLQLIVIDDGSDDGTPDYLASLADERAERIRTENHGVSAARNLALSKIRGSYVMFVDADDTIEPQAIEQAVRFAREHDLDMAVGGLTKDYGSRKVVFGRATEKRSAIYGGPEVEKVIEKTVAYDVPGDPYLSSFFMSGSVCKLIRAELLDGLEFDPALAVGEDTHFNVRVLKRCERVGFISCNWYTYFIREDSAVRRFRPDAFANAELLLRRLRDELCSGRDEGLWPPCVVARGVRQFLGACKATAVHEESGNGFFAAAGQIRAYLNDDFWSDLFSHGERWLPYVCEDQYRFAGRTCWKRNAALLCLFLKATQAKASLSARKGDNAR